MYNYLSYKYKICQDDWVMDINLPIAKMKVQFEKETQNLCTAHTICDATETSKLIDIISLE